MQPSTASGRRLRLALFPLALFVAFATVVGVLKVVASLRSSSVRGVLHTESHWMLAVFLPAMSLGFILGLICMNLFAYIIPPLRRAFDDECRQTGRHGFAPATLALAGLGGMLLLITSIGVFAFIRFGSPNLSRRMEMAGTQAQTKKAAVSTHASREAAVDLLRHEGILRGETRLVSATWNGNFWLISLRDPSGTVSNWTVDATAENYSYVCKH